MTKALNVKLVAVLLFAVVAVLTISGAAFAVSNKSNPQSNTRPGWGYGDKNHVHTGPPGLSVNPH